MANRSRSSIFDAAAPGSRAFDLRYAAWLWLDVDAPHYSADKRWGVFNYLPIVRALARRYLNFSMPWSIVSAS
jgi:hypothetical protein